MSDQIDPLPSRRHSIRSSASSIAAETPLVTPLAHDALTARLIAAALPEIFTGIRIGVSLTLIGTLLGEMFASRRGLGCRLMGAIGLHDIDVIMAITFVLVAFAAVVSSVLSAVDRKLHDRA
jgi:ABC-type nitrate/sulfonate/bicarbonate transport system permease component